MKIEKREMTAEVSQNDSRVTGLGIVYDTETELWPGFMEKIRSGAFSDSVQEALEGKRNIKSFYNHDPNQVLATMESDPPLMLQERDGGVMYDAEIPSTSYGNDLRENLKRKNVKGSSFAFGVFENGDIWTEDENGIIHREVIKGELYELGPVTNPAYLPANASLRSTKEAYQEFVQANKRYELENKKRKLELHKKQWELK